MIALFWIGALVVIVLALPIKDKEYEEWKNDKNR